MKLVRFYSAKDSFSTAARTGRFVFQKKERPSPVEMYCRSLKDYDTLLSAGCEKEARRSLYLSVAAVNNGDCQESLLLAIIRSYLYRKEGSDFKLYYLIQVCRYLTQKRDKFFSCLPEKDMIDALIEERWGCFCRETSERFVLLSPVQKIELFRNDLIVFPI